jgi:hypothetical protein
VGEKESFRAFRRTWHVLQSGLARISRHGSGRAGLQPRRYKAFLIIPLSRAPRSPSADGLRGARDQQRVGAAISAGLKPRPSGSPLRASKRGEKSALGHPGRTAIKCSQEAMTSAIA